MFKNSYLCDKGSGVEVLDLPKEHLDIIRNVLEINKAIVNKLCNPAVVVTGDVGLPDGYK